MFAPLGLFKDISCPQGQQCSLLACMFSHSETSHPLEYQNISQHIDTKHTVKGDVHLPKKTKVQHTVEVEKHQPKSPSPTASQSKDGSQKSALGSTTAKNPHFSGSAIAKHQPAPREGSVSSERVAKSASLTVDKPGSRLPPRKAPNERLNPRMLTKAPAPHGVRLAILTKLHASMSALNTKMAQSKVNTDRGLVLTPSELITMALDEEEKAAKDNPTIYTNVIKLRIVKLSKLSQDDWAKEVTAHLNQRYYKLETKDTGEKPRVFTTSLSVEEELAIVEKLVTPLEGLEQYGYVTKAPAAEAIETARKGVTESKGWEKCDRCGGRFQVFPGRREDGSLTSGGSCVYHPGKSFYPPRKKTDHITGPKEAYYSCCNETLGTSSGCTKGETHVFKVSETKRLASILQFEMTPENPNKELKSPVCFDCEMGFTTLGLELIRLTAVSWPEGKKLLDVLVRPMGEVLDLNSRFSGVFPEHYTKAIPYGTGKRRLSTADPGDAEAMPLQVVDSPAAARALLFDLLQPTTPLIGHAIDNDLNACRIIHPTIIDTAILYPHPGGGLPYRMSLKTLSRKYLDREIQSGGNKGHDSNEDAIATGDLVRVKAAETWKNLKQKGWTIQHGKLIPPPGHTETAAIHERKLGSGAGQKRASSNTAH